MYEVRSVKDKASYFLVYHVFLKNSIWLIIQQAVTSFQNNDIIYLQNGKMSINCETNEIVPSSAKFDFTWYPFDSHKFMMPFAMGKQS